MILAKKYLNHLSIAYSALNKNLVTLPVLASSFFFSHWLYERFTSYYLNPFDREVAHISMIDYAEKYNVKKDEVLEDWEHTLSLTPFERLRKQFKQEMVKVDVDGEKIFRRLSKDRDDSYYVLGKARNLENISYLNPEDIKHIDNPLELQMRLDSVMPTLNKTGDMDSHVNHLHETLENHKYTIENSKNFRSVKDKFLGLPFMLLRHRQHPEPTRGTWQYDLYESVFGEPYDFMKDVPELEEKVNKYNYRLFLHPSVINKYDTGSEEFDMYLRQLNLETKSQQEIRSLNREYFSNKLMPYLNLIRNKEDGYDLANYIINKEQSSEYENYLYEQYSGQKEEKLFREVEEYNFMNKNQPFVERTQFANINTERIGIKASELNQILNNPTKAKNLRRAMEKKYFHYQPVDYIDKLKYARHRTQYIQTVLDNDLDINDPKLDETLQELQNGTRDRSEEELAMLQYEKDNPIFGVDNHHNPLPFRAFHAYYDNQLDWNDYNTTFPKGFLSPKKDRYELLSNHLRWKGKIKLI
jgi:hypothetical protein